jgi:hypothetical protein
MMVPADENPAPRSTRPLSSRPPGAARPGSIAESITKRSGVQVPPPPGRKLALMLIGAAVLIALVITFVKGGGPGTRLRKDLSERTMEPQVPAERPGESRTTPTSPAAPPASEAPRPRPVERTMPPVPTPAGLSAGLSRELGTRLSSLAGDVTVARAALHDLSRLVSSTPEDRREEVRAFVLDHVAIAAKREALRSAVFDAALALGPSGEGGKAIVALAVREGVDDDASSAAAILLLAAQPGAGGPDALGRLDALVSDAYRPLHLRVLAARVRPREGRPESIARLADDPATPAALRDALR